MEGSSILAWSPRTFGVASAIVTVGLGLAYLAAASAPVQYLAVNTGALVVSLVLVGAWTRWAASGTSGSGLAVLAIGLALLATALSGQAVDGVRRWVSFGPLSLQPSLILLSLMTVLYASRQSPLATAGVVVAALALALQPDRAMAGALAFALVTLALTRPERQATVAMVAAILGFAATLLRADTLPPQPYVEGVLQSAFQVHALVGLAVWSGVVLMIIPALVGWLRDTEQRPIYAVFGAVWLAVAVAAALGNYPTPLVAYGASSILGYVLSLSAFSGGGGTQSPVRRPQRIL